MKELAQNLVGISTKHLKLKLRRAIAKDDENKTRRKILTENP
jgi:hypothetical protein